jgi:hypothetical protein
MRSLLVSAALALTVIGAAVPAIAAASPANSSVQIASGVMPAAYHQRSRGRVPRYLRGFDDPGYAYHGNINGCAEDLGYGRWESCDY